MTILVSNLQDTDIDQPIESSHIDYKCIDDKYNYILHLLHQIIKKKYLNLIYIVEIYYIRGCVQHRSC
jgi:hypothetical protein